MSTKTTSLCTPPAPKSQQRTQNGWCDLRERDDERAEDDSQGADEVEEKSLKICQPTFAFIRKQPELRQLSSL